MRTGEQPRLLLIDDSVGQRDLYEAALAREFSILTATREEGVALAASARPDAIVVDVVMPGIDGWETCARIKRQPDTASIPVILLTDTNEPRVSEHAAAVGATAVLLKPCAADTLRNAVLVAINCCIPPAPDQRAMPPTRAAEADGLLWETVTDRTTWTATVGADNPTGFWKVQILRSGELAASRRFETREQAVKWAQSERAALGAAAAPKH